MDPIHGRAVIAGDDEGRVTRKAVEEVGELLVEARDVRLVGLTRDPVAVGHVIGVRKVEHGNGDRRVCGQ